MAKFGSLFLLMCFWHPGSGNGSESLVKSWIESENGTLPEEAWDLLRSVSVAPELEMDNDLPIPPWEVFPDIEKGSIGWRMGAGEDYLSIFRKWYDSLSVRDKKNYTKRYPIPEVWADMF